MLTGTHLSSLRGTMIGLMSRAFSWPPFRGERGQDTRGKCRRNEIASRASTMKGNGWTKGKGFSFLMAASVAAILIVTAKTVYDYGVSPVRGEVADAKKAAYFAAHPGPFCAFQGVWYDWEHDETIKLGCLEVKGNIREGSYSSATGPRATWNYS